MSKKFRWSQVYESSEEELIDLLQIRQLDSNRIYANADDEQQEQLTNTPTTIWCVEGSFTIQINASAISLQPGDAIDIEANTTYLIQPGFADCAYYLTTMQK